uniref:Integrase core domain containing protein n=2 Tax=Solanum tuberosum TaxID=4113 RepID=M1DP97_SOLTU
MMNFEGDGIKDYDELVSALDRFEFRSKPKRLELDMKSHDSPPIKPSVEDAPKLDCGRCSKIGAQGSTISFEVVFLGDDGTLSVIIAADLSEVQVEAFVFVLKRFKRDNWMDYCGHY